jgi:hypothetical protein
LVLGEGALTLLAVDGLDRQGRNPMTVDRFSAEIVPVQQLAAAPAGWRLLGCGLRAVAADSAGQAASFLTRGLTACLAQPSKPGAGAQPRLAYFDPRPGIARWVFIPSREAGGAICSSRFHLPATFALLTAAP